MISEKATSMKHADGPLHRDAYAVYLPAVNDSYAAETTKELPTDRPFPDDLTLRDLVFWEPNQLWHYPYLLHSVGLFAVGSLPDNSVTQRNRANNTLVGDSGGFQIGKGSMKGLLSLRAKPMPAHAAVAAWQQESRARDWIVGWLDTYADYAMTLDMPLWASSPDGASSPFHNCTTAQLIDMTVQNLRYIDKRTDGRTKWLNVVQGGGATTDIAVWWDAVKWFRRGGWALAGSAGAKGGIANMLRTLLMMRDDSAFEPGQDWVHVLGISTPKWAVLLTAVQQALRQCNPSLRVSFDSSSPFQTGGRYEDAALTPAFTRDEGTWSIGTESAPQSRLHADASLATPFAHDQSPIGRRLQLRHFSVRGGVWDQRHFDSISNTLLTNHNVWVYLDAMKQANDLAAARDSVRVPARYLECLAFIDDVFRRDSWDDSIVSNKGMLDAVAPSGYKAA
jgi:hypothetical protein